jgi:outer membrane biosynthesis protein TonB
MLRTAWEHPIAGTPTRTANGDGVVDVSDCQGDAWCWDSNENRIRDAEEDTNGDGSIDTRDCTGDNILAVHSSKVKPKRRVQPRFPEAALAMGKKGDVQCTVHFYVDQKGVPTAVKIQDGCPTVYHESIKKAAWEWRFYPYKNESGNKVEVQFMLKLTFRLN